MERSKFMFFLISIILFSSRSVTTQNITNTTTAPTTTKPPVTTTPKATTLATTKTIMTKQETTKPTPTTMETTTKPIKYHQCANNKFCGNHGVCYESIENPSTKFCK